MPWSTRELEATITRLKLAREELSHVIEHSAPTDLPPGFSEVAENTSATDRAMLLIYSRILGPDEMASLRELLDDAFASLYTPAQRDVLRRIREN